jgi:hypothetical protein
MTGSLIIRNIFFGFLSWLIPFGVAFFFYNRNGELLVSYDLFKSIMIVVGAIVGCYLLYRYFKILSNHYILNGFIIGFSWFAINIIMDSIVLIPMMKTTFINYFFSIGMRYTVILVMSITIGYLLEHKDLGTKMINHTKVL